jgi:UDP-N-acetylglucosamine 2-epimerase (non-hydrolysing)
MAKPRVTVVLGTRPEAVKLAPVVKALRDGGEVDCRVVVTGQHRRMLDQALAAFGLRPHRDLRLLRRGQSHELFTVRARAALDRLFRTERPALVLVQGDTSSALAGALAARRAGVPLGHVEAGLRTFDFSDPNPEEFNRAAIDALSDLHFPPTPGAARNLRAAGVRADSVGNTGIDALRWAVSRKVPPRDPRLRAALAALGPGDRAALVTTHRRESLGAPLEGLCRAFVRLLDAEPRLHLLYPVHLNPAVHATVRALVRHPRAHLLPPLGYFDLLAAMKAARFVMTDSGGLVEEAAALGRPCLILRRATERPEALAAGVALLAGTRERAVFAAARRLAADDALRRRMARPSRAFGDGRSSGRIARAIARALRRRPESRADFARLPDR